MAEFHGKEGNVLLGAGQGTPEIDANIIKWQITRDVELVPAKTVDSTVAQTAPSAHSSVLGWVKDTGSFEGYLVSGTGAVMSDFDGAAATASFRSGDGTNYTASIKITSLSIENAVDDLGKFSATFECDAGGLVADPAAP